MLLEKLIELCLTVCLCVFGFIHKYFNSLSLSDVIAGSGRLDDLFCGFGGAPGDDTFGIFAERAEHFPIRAGCRHASLFLVVFEARTHSDAGSAAPFLHQSA